MRLKGTIDNIDYNETQRFFENRAAGFNEDNPYSVTMYQDNNKELVLARNEKEISKLRPMLKLCEDSKVLDIACGIGRWADALPEYIKEYCGIDFSGELIRIANSRNRKENFYFYEGNTGAIEETLKKNGKGNYNTVLMMGILVYLNDSDIKSCLEQTERMCGENAIICIREPVGVDSRLTLKDFYSEELKSTYNAIYRTRDELMAFFKETFLEKGFLVADEGMLFGEALNNRKETVQYYFILERVN